MLEQIPAFQIHEPKFVFNPQWYILPERCTQWQIVHNDFEVRWRVEIEDMISMQVLESKVFYTQM